jgi:hypothetical protein
MVKTDRHEPASKGGNAGPDRAGQGNRRPVGPDGVMDLKQQASGRLSKRIRHQHGVALDFRSWHTGGDDRNECGGYQGSSH